MGIKGMITKQFIDVLEWNESENGVLAFRYPMEDREIQNGGQLTVRESQLALFVNEGKIADLFKPGRYNLSTRTLPILTSLKNWDKLFESPFKSDVYFFSTREQIDQKWGTPTPIILRDKEFGPLRLRAHGTYSYQLSNPQVFFQKISGTRDVYTTQDLEGQLRAGIVTNLASFLGAAATSFIDMAANQIKFSELLKSELDKTFNNYGLKLASFYVQSISLPEELQVHFDKAASMNLVGDLKRYVQFQTAESISLAAQNEGGLAGAGAGLGAGIAIGQTMFSGLTGGVNQPGEGVDPLAMIARLHDLLTKGVLTQAEFDAKKAELLKKIT